MNTPLTDFKEGQRVKVTNHPNTQHLAGQIGTIANIEDYGFWIDMDEPSDYPRLYLYDYEIEPCPITQQEILESYSID